MSKDPYAVLGVAKDASEEEIRRVYKRLAKEFHPDLNPGKPEAEERFKEISAAFGLLGDAEKRARYDRGEIDASGAEMPQHGFYREYADAGGAHRYHSSAGYQDFGDVSDLFADLFGRGPGGGEGRGFGRASNRGADVRYHLTIDFLEAANGGKTRVGLPEGKSLDLTIPAGVTDGQVLRLKGQGLPGAEGAPAGDAYVELRIRPHPRFERQGDDILTELSVTLDEAVLGAKVGVPTISGRVSLAVPKASSSGQVLRLKGKGIARAGGKTPGDQLVRLRVVLPEVIDPELEAFMASWREKHRYSVRQDGE